MKIATWNINGIKARLDGVCEWLKQAEPDLVCFQEIKSVDENFPGSVFEDMGFNVATHGQKGFNGVAILSKSPFEEIRKGLPGDEHDEQARFIDVTTKGGKRSVRIAGAYMPNGNPLGTEKFEYKLAWLARLEDWIAQVLADEVPLVLMGDFNIIPEPEDAKNPQSWSDDALFQPESRHVYRRLRNAGLTDSVRSVTAEPETFTFWDFQAGAWQKNNGIRIDHILLSAEAADMMEESGIDSHVRGWERPSDHVPVWVSLAT